MDGDGYYRRLELRLLGAALAALAVILPLAAGIALGLAG